MPTFETPHPISVTLNLGAVAANVRVSATDRADTTVDVRPVNESSKADVRIVGQTRVEFAHDRLSVTAPKVGSLFGRSGSVDVTIELPAGSQLQGDTGMGELQSDGRLGDCRFRTAYGQIRLDQVGRARLTTASGAVTVNHADGDAEFTTGSGDVHVRRVDGSATVKNSNGDSWLGEVGGDVRVKAANGTITVERAHAGVTAKTANGGIRIGEVARGVVALETAAGSVEIGIHTGTAAWLDLATTAGRVRNEMAAATGPDGAEDTVEVRVRTHAGDVTVRRS